MAHPDTLNDTPGKARQLVSPRPRNPTIPGDLPNVGQITVTVQGELDRVQLTTAAMELRPDQLGEAIERAYVHAYQEALLQVDQILDRISQDVDGNRALVTQIKEIRTNYSDLKALKTILKRRQRNADPESGWEDPTEWDPAADPLRRGI